MLNDEDLVIVISLSGNTPSIQETLKNLMLKQVSVLGITAFGDSFFKTTLHLSTVLRN